MALGWWVDDLIVKEEWITPLMAFSATRRGVGRHAIGSWFSTLMESWLRSPSEWLSNPISLCRYFTWMIACFHVNCNPLMVRRLHGPPSLARSADLSAKQGCMEAAHNLW